ncbi:hypothetical protein ES708_18273 [subsurface metagenome]
MKMKKISILCLLIIAVILPSLLSAQEENPWRMLDGAPYDRDIHPNPDLFMSSWKESMPRHSHGNLIERDMLTPSEGDPLHPATRGAVLRYVKRLSHAILPAHETTSPFMPVGEQEIIYIDTGNGILNAGSQSIELREGILLLIPVGIEYTMTNTGGESLTMYIIVEPVPDGFVPKKQVQVKDEKTLPFGGTTGHWTHMTKSGFREGEGLATLTGLCPVWYAPMTMGQPHSHFKDVEEIWFSLRGDITILLGKQLRKFPAGTAYKIPPDGNTPHSTINTGGILYAVPGG